MANNTMAPNKCPARRVHQNILSVVWIRQLIFCLFVSGYMVIRFNSVEASQRLTPISQLEGVLGDKRAIYFNPNPSTRSQNSLRKYLHNQASDKPEDWSFFKSLLSARNNQNASTKPETNTLRPATSTTSAPTSTSTSLPALSANIDSEADTELVSIPSTTKSTTTTATMAESIYTETTTTTEPPLSTPETDTRESGNRVLVGALDQNASIDPLFSKEMHRSIQEVVNRIVKASDQAKNKVSSLNLTTPQPNFRYSNATTAKGSLSLNVLLKNFGIHNLTNLDQILLRSSLRNETSSYRRMSTSTTEDMDSEDLRSAECRIEYTVKHVNLSLMNAAHGDYTCDYSIDRRLVVDKSHKEQAKRVCRLQLTSAFFTNRSTTSCPESHISVGALKFCHLHLKEVHEIGLNRTFDFPLTRDSFEVKVVHRESEDTALDNGSHIQLEIKPMTDCSDLKTKGNTSKQGRLIETKPSSTSTTTSSTTTSTTTTTTTPAPSISSTTLKPTVRATTYFANTLQNRQSLRLLKKPKLQTEKEEEQQETLCDGTIHSTYQGQIKTPDYPNLYAANTSCYFEFAPSSAKYCSLLLQFRDFDLISHKKRRVASDEECSEDYLQIGRTLYCNRYAMIGHKMQLPLSNGGKPLRIYFRTNDMQAGRGFLAKYQQLPCIEEEQEHQAKSNIVYETANRSSQYPVEESFVSTHEPPLQKPDFDTIARISTRTPTPRKHDNKTTASAQPLEASTSSLIASLLPGQSCGSLEGDMSFLLKSPGHPSNYPSNIECLYYIRRNASEICYLELTYLEFDLEPDTSCRYDYLEVNGVRLCGSLKELQHKTTRIYGFDEPIKLIKFKSDSSGSRSGFLIRAEQLPCSEGSILLRSKAIDARPLQLSHLNHTTTSKLSRTIQYDFATTSSIEPPPPPLEDRHLVPSTAAACDRALFGREVTIRSPYWPESYSTDETLTSCRYKIYRDQSSSNRVCQLELRFVHLHLGTSDCIDVDGHELLCGFNTRNLVSYYPFEAQTQLTITFLTGLARLAGRSIPAARSSDLLPGRAANKFMIIAKQHECVDGFLAPEVPAIDTPTPINGTLTSLTALNKPNLMYSLLTSKNRSSEISCPELIVQKKDELRSIGYPDGYSRGICRLQVAAESSRFCQLELEFLDLDLGPLVSTSLESSSEFLLNTDEQCTTNYLQLAHSGQRLCKINQLIKRRIRLPFHAISRSATILIHLDQASRQQRGFFAKMKQIECPSMRGDQNLHLPSTTCNRRLSQPIGLISSAGLRGPSVCHLDLQLLPGFCRIQLSFTIFDLGSRAGIEQRCALDYLELGGERYCAQELANITRILAPVKPLERTLSLHYWPGVETGTFRATFRQMSCEPEPLPSILPHQSPVNQLGSLDRSPILVTTEIPQLSIISDSKTEFREILMRDELFELDSRQLSEPKNGASVRGSNRTTTYEPNQFIVFRIRKSSPLTCGLRLLFYRLDLEPSSGCKRDFLDINGLDRICGQLDPSSSEAPLGRVYSWSSTDRDFLISFVTDQYDERSGFFIMAHQLNNCPTTQPHNAAPSIATSLSQASADDETTKVPVLESPTTTAPTPTCHKLISDTDFQVSSPSWPLRYQRGVRCHYLVEKNGPNICSLSIRLMSLVLGGHDISQAENCRADEDQLLLDGKPVCGQTGSPYALSFNFSGRTFIELSFRGPQGAGLGFHLEGRQEECASVSVEGPQDHFDSHVLAAQEALNNSPPVNPLSQSIAHIPSAKPIKNQCGGYLGPEEDLLQGSATDFLEECVVVVRRANESVCGLDLTVERFQLEPPDRQSKRCQTEYLELEGSRICGGYPAGHRLRFGFELGQQEKIVRFRANHLALRLSQRTQCGSPELDTDRDLIGYLPSSEHGLANTTSDLELSGTLCQFVHQRRRQFIVSPGFGHSIGESQGNLHCLYRILAASYEFCSVRLQLLDLELDSSRECHLDYLLIDQQRYCMPATNQTLEIAIPESLPREIQLVYHTGGSRFRNRRGFRLFYEQIPCDTSSSLKSTDKQERDARRAHFGQLSYPSNYVSDSSLAGSSGSTDKARGSVMQPEAPTPPDEVKLNKEIVVAPAHRKQAT